MYLTQNSIQTIKNYRVHNTSKIDSVNKIHIGSQVSSPQSNPLFILKNYNTALGYQQEVRVFQIQSLYEGYFVQSFTLQDNQNREQYFSVCSLIDLAKTIKHFPLQIAKFYMHSLLSKLKRIHSTVNIPYRPIYASDLIFSSQKQLYIVGWSKIQQQLTQQQVIFDCAEIFYFMITNGVFQDRGTRKITGLCKFLNEKFWSINKHKHPYLRFFPQEKTQLNKLVNLFKKMTLKQPDTTRTINQILSDPFFDDIIQFGVASQRLNQIQSYQISQQKQRVLKDLDRKIKIKKEIKVCKQELESKEYQIQQINNKRGIRSIQVLQSQDLDEQGYTEVQQQIQIPFMISINKNELENQKNKNIFNPQMMCQLIYFYLNQKLKRNNIGYQIFEQDWIEANFQLKRGSQTQGQIRYEILCNLFFTKSQQNQKEIQKYVFELNIQFNDHIPNQNCIKQYRLIHINGQLNQILFYKLEDYLTQDLRYLMMYTDS